MRERDDPLYRPVILMSQHRHNKVCVSIHHLYFFSWKFVEMQPGRAAVSGGTLKAVFIRLKMSHSALRYDIVTGSQQRYAPWNYCGVILRK